MTIINPLVQQIFFEDDSGRSAWSDTVSRSQTTASQSDKEGDPARFSSSKWVHAQILRDHQSHGEMDSAASRDTKEAV